jgi:copper chaperone
MLAAKAPRRAKHLEGFTMEMVTMKAPDISCEHCVATVKKTVGQFPGVQSVEADAETKIITLTYDPTRADLPKIEEALEEEGYPVQK